MDQQHVEALGGSFGCSPHTSVGWSQDCGSSKHSLPICGSVVLGPQRESNSTIPTRSSPSRSSSLRCWSKLEIQKEFWGHEKGPKLPTPKSGLHFSLAKSQEPQHDWWGQEDSLQRRHAASPRYLNKKVRKTNASSLFKAEHILWPLSLTLSAFHSDPLTWKSTP